ncbi:MAG: triose-phosphate isomerase [Holosporaceae bacterium]|jgi:triosephosphate isomerase|nr:triose-phosphate isomerase [Holosporaceae bacterium]
MKIIVANWKMNGTVAFADRFIEEINLVDSKNLAVVCPPAALIGRFRDFRYKIGAQNCFSENEGAFTGENSPKLLKEIGCEYVIVGHSERRAIFGETDESVFKKWKAAIENRLTPIVCVGEKANERENWREILSGQLKLFLNETLSETIFAYEPVWSIGTGVIPTKESIETVFEFLKELLGNQTRLLYGGSVNSQNAEQILNCKNVSGLLIGGASLKIDEFKKIMEMKR